VDLFIEVITEFDGICMEILNVVRSSGTFLVLQKKRERIAGRCNFFLPSGGLVIPENGFVRSKMV
jgi:hypothetical protein